MKSVDDLSRRIVDLEDDLENRMLELDDITNMGVMLTSMLDVDAILSAMMEMSLRIVSAEVGCILLAEDGELITRTSWGVDASLIRQIKVDGDTDIAGRAYRSGETVVMNDFAPDTEVNAVINSIICVPISYKSGPVGVLVAVNKTADGGFTEGDTLTLERLVNFAAVAIENARLMQYKLERQRMEQELSLAREVQKALLPSVDINYEGIQLEDLYIPAGQVGGDYFDLIPISDTEFIVIVGDVSNKGVPAALMMTAVRSAIRAIATEGKDVGGVVTRINDVLSLDVMKRPDVFTSLVFARFDMENRTCTYTNAGHLPPLLHNRIDNSLRQLKTGGTILGQFEGFEYKAEVVDLRKSDRILLFTDGVTEVFNTSGEMYGLERLGEFLVAGGDATARDFLQDLRSDVETFARDASDTPFDDLTAVVVDFEGAGCGR